MHRGSRKDRDRGGSVAHDAVATAGRGRADDGGLYSSTDTSGSSSHGCELRHQQPVAAGGGGGVGGAGGSSVQLRPDSLKDFQERVDSTIQQLSGLVSLLSSRDAAVRDSRQQPQQHQQQHPKNSSNKDNSSGPPCCCRCHAAADGGIQVSLPPPVTQPTMTTTSTASRRQARSSRDFSAAISAAASAASATAGRRSALPPPQPPPPVAGMQFSGDASEANSGERRKASGGSLSEPPASGSGIRFLWYDSSRKRYSVKEAELICAKSVKRLHLSVHYFRVAGEDLLLLEKDCSDDGLAFLDVDSLVAFEGLSVEKVLKLQKLGCQLRPEDLSREFAVEKGRSKYYVVPVEEEAGDWRLCAGSGAQKLDSLKSVLERQELRKGKKSAAALT